MFAFDQHHSPEGIRELRVHVAETIREHLATEKVRFLHSNPVAEIIAVGTVGYVTQGLPDIVFGADVNANAGGDEFWFAAVEKLQKYMAIYGIPTADHPIDPIQFANFGKEEHEPPVTSHDQLGVGNKEIRIIRIDSARWFAGMGWQQAQWYTEEERRNAVILQWVVPDSKNAYPESPDWSGPYQHLFETEPFGKRTWTSEDSVRTARNRYMH